MVTGILVMATRLIEYRHVRSSVARVSYSQQLVYIVIRSVVTFVVRVSYRERTEVSHL